MGYLHIPNLYKDERIRLFKDVYCLEKVDGASAHIKWVENKLHFFGGCVKSERFSELFDKDCLTRAFHEIGQDQITIFGEAYGGKIQKQSKRYGKELSFIVFDVKIGESWLSVLQADIVAHKLGLEFVPYWYGPSDMVFLDTQRDSQSLVAFKRGMGTGHRREGIVIRPPFEVRLNNGERLIAKYKRDEFRETATPRKVGVNPLVITEAETIAIEWVTATRLDHVLNHHPEFVGREDTKFVCDCMVEDVYREGAGELVESKETRTAIKRRAAKLWLARLSKKEG